MSMESINDADEYQIEVAGVLDPSWSEWLDGLAVQSDHEQHSQPTSLLTGRIIDQAHLRGILVKIWDLNLKVISVRMVHSAGEG